jgi:hypothetical protein
VVFWVGTNVSGKHAASSFTVDPVSGGRIFLKNVGTHLPDYTTTVSTLSAVEIRRLGNTSLKLYRMVTLHGG